ERAQAFALGCADAVEALEEEASARRAIEFLGASDWLRWTVPAEFGGADNEGLTEADEVSVRALCSIRSGLAYASGMLDVMLVMQGLGSYPIARAGQAALRAEVLPMVAQGQRLAAFALTETGAGSSLGEVATRAERNGDGWRLNGSKTFISNAPVADFFSVLARTSGEPGDGDSNALTMFYVPGETRGLEVRPFEVMSPHPIGEVDFHDLNIPDEFRLGELGSGLDLALATLARFRTSVAAAACGFSRRALHESVRHLESRKQFGRPLSSFQGLRFDLAEMDTKLSAAQLLVDAASSAVDAGESGTREVARAKLFATESASWICDRAVQHLGGLGVRRGEVVERLFREVRALRIYEGTSEVQKLILAKELLASLRTTETKPV
ncbi:MAG: acyl-CoA dehydrogenase, partial [Planctomycetota bacterium]